MKFVYDIKTLILFVAIVEISNLKNLQRFVSQSHLHQAVLNVFLLAIALFENEYSCRTRREFLFRLLSVNMEELK